MDDPSSTPFVTPGPEEQCAILDNPGAAQRGDFNVYALRRGVFMNYTGILSVRIRPHLITTRAHVDEAMGAPFDVAAEMTA
jgi:4-aminobutyrate aminotransferase-like enzyme